MMTSMFLSLILSGGGDAPLQQTATSAATTTVTFRSYGRVVSIVEAGPAAKAVDAVFHRRFSADGRVFYRSRLRHDGARWEWKVDIGHALQTGRVIISRGLVVGMDANGHAIWSGRTTHPICVPDVFAEIAVHYDARLRRGEKLICMTPVPKARKLAPLAVRRIADSAEGHRRYSIGPGSLGMRVFVKTTILELSADGRVLLAQRGQFEASYPEGRFRYIEGDAMYSTPHALVSLPNAFFGTGEPP